MSLQVLAPGLLTTVQAGARHGHRHLGVAAAGALDGYSLRVANLLVGNAETAAALEITLHGPRLRFEHGSDIAITGADIEADIDGQPLPGWRTVRVPAGAELKFGACRRGARAYLALAGGIDVAALLGSASTDLRAGFGGLHGRALLAGDVVPLVPAATGKTAELRIAPWWIDPGPDLDFSDVVSVRLLPGSDALAAGVDIFSGTYRISPASNRQGLRLEGKMLAIADPRERISEPVAPGTVQLPPDGQPIVLLADAQTVGGYPRIGHVASVDWPQLAQLRPGHHLRFVAIDAADAHTMACGQRQRLARIALAIEQRRAWR